MLMLLARFWVGLGSRQLLAVNGVGRGGHGGGGRAGVEVTMR